MNAQFDNFRAALEARGLSLRLQWKERREQGAMSSYLIYGPNAKHREMLVFTWTDGGYQSYFPLTTNSIAEDVAHIMGEDLA